MAAWYEQDIPVPMHDIDLEKKAEELGIEYFIPSVCSLNIGLRGPIVPREVIRKVQQNGYNMCGIGDFGYGCHEPECYMIPDPTSLIQLPWKPNFGWLACFVYFKGKPDERCPRRILMRQINKLKEHNLVLKTGIEPEFTLIHPEKDEELDPRECGVPLQHEPVKEMKHIAFITKVIDCLKKLNWGVYQMMHEYAPNQYEVNFWYTDALASADRHAFIKFMIKTLALEHGVRATFMPQMGLGQDRVFGNGLHVHHSLWSHDEDKDMMADKENRLGMSKTATHWLAGLMDHMMAVTALVCSTPNSYKRLHYLNNFMNIQAYAVDNKLPAVRIVHLRGEANRFEFKPGDNAVNPYILASALIAAGLDGLNKEKELNPKQEISGDIFCKETPEGVRTLPKTLPDALAQLKADDYMRDALGKVLIESYIKVKEQMLDDYNREVTPWEMKYIELY